MPAKTLWIKEEHLRPILEQRKTIEVRVAYENVAKLQPGDQLLLNDEHLFVIMRIARYASFEELLANEDPEAMAPGLSKEALLEALRATYPPGKERLGVVALEIVPAQASA